MVLLESLLPVFQTDESACSEYAGLCHLSTQDLSENPSMLDVFFVANDHTAHWTTHAFTQTEADCVEIFHHLRWIRAADTLRRLRGGSG